MVQHGDEIASKEVPEPGKANHRPICPVGKRRFIERTEPMSNSDRYHKDYYVSWEMFQTDCRALTWKLLEIREDWSHIVAITRGGLAPATILSTELDIHYIDTVCISSYILKEQASEAKLLQQISKALTEQADETWLIIDDLVDTGKTAQFVKKLFPRSHFATIYAKPQGLQYVDTCLTCLSQDTWVNFPWDTTSAPRIEVPICEKYKSIKGEQ